MKKNASHWSTRLKICSKFLITMKLIFFIVLLDFGVSFASVYSQNQKISLQLENSSLQGMIEQIQAQSNYNFLYSNADIEGIDGLNHSFSNTSVKEILEVCLEGTDLDYTLRDRVIVLKTAEEEKEKQPATPPDERTITGKVISGKNGKPIPGVNILLKGTNQGTVTDMSGRYNLEVPEEGGTLVFSAVGYQKVEVKIKDQKTINVTLKVDEVAMEEVVVVGYGTQRKRDVTGSMSEVEVKEEATVSSPSFEEALQGSVPGVNVQKSSGKLGGAIMMKIRGSSSVSADNQPLYVVDGMPITSQSYSTGGNAPTNPLADLNYNAIESIQVLKDAAATAIYGSRASNGVVLITTKGGKAGETQYNASMTMGTNTPSQLRDWCNADQYMTMINESLNNVVDPETGLYDGWKTPEALKDLYIPGWRNDNNVNWQQQALRQGMVKKFNFSASGGNKKNTFYAGLTYNDQTGIIMGNDLEKISGRLNLDHQASDNIKFGLSTNFTRTQQNRVTSDNTWANPMMLVAIPPVQPVKNPETDKLNTNTVYYNSLISIRDGRNKRKSYRAILNGYMDIQIVKNLSFRSEVGTDIMNQFEKTYWGRQTNWGQPAGEGMDREVGVRNYNTNNYFTYDWSNDIHRLKATLGMSYQEKQTEGSRLEAKGFPSDAFKNLSNASEVTSFGEWGYGNSFLSYYARSNYQYKGKYLLSLSGRIDGSSRFGENSKYGFFPAGSLGWIISEENFMQNIEAISYLKLRTSYGITGNAGIGNYESYGLYDGTTYVGNPALIPAQLKSPNLKWETTSQFNVGLDYGFADDRISGSIDYYYKHTTDLLLNRSLPATSGFGAVTKNVGSLKNYGLEFAITTHNLKGQFSWITDFNISANRNEILDIAGPEISYGSNYVIEGEDIGVFKLVEYAGVHPMTGDALFYKNDGSGMTTDDYNEANRVVAGSPNPEFTGGLNNRFEYKNFDLSILTNFVYGNDVYLSAGRYQSANFEWWDNQTTDQLDRWQEPGDVTDVPEPRFGQANGSQHSTRYLHEGSYLRIKQLTLGYNLPESVLKNLRISSARIFVSASNLYTFTNYPGYDPEVSSLPAGGSSQAYNVMMGVDFYTAPQIRSYKIGLDVNF